jgi:hypothetical protein
MDTRGDLIAYAASIQDTVHVIDLAGGPARMVTLPSDVFRTAQPPTPEALQAPRLWLESFSLVTDVFLVSDEIVLIQFLDRVNRNPAFRLVAMSLDGRRLFSLRDTPRMLAWDDDSQLLLGYRSLTTYPNELAWYRVQLPH